MPSTEFKGGKVEYRTDRYGNVHVPLGKVSFELDKLEANFRAVLDELQRAKPASAKGRYLRKMTVSSTMGPGVKLDTNRLRAATSPTPEPAQRADAAVRRRAASTSLWKRLWTYTFSPERVGLPPQAARLADARRPRQAAQQRLRCAHRPTPGVEHGDPLVRHDHGPVRVLEHHDQPAQRTPSSR